MRTPTWLLASLLVALAIVGVALPGAFDPGRPATEPAGAARPAEEGSLIRTETRSPEGDAVAPTRTRTLPTPVWSTIVVLLAALLALVRGQTVRWDAVAEVASARAASFRSGTWATRAPPVAGRTLPAT